MRRSDGDIADEPRRAAAKEQYQQERHAADMTRNVLRGLHHYDAVAYPNYGIEPQLTIGIGIVYTAHHPAVMDDGNDCVEYGSRPLRAEPNKHQSNENCGDPDEEQPILQ